jgi:NAD(P)-dependent dehydrogenase (short-subunit alcohol dehydrogenase family)
MGLAPISSGTSAGPDLTGRVAIVTGAARGIGRASAELLAAHGAAVALVDVVPPDETLAAVAEAGGKAVGAVADVTDGAAISRVLDEVVEAFGRVDILVNNVGLGDRVALADVDREFFVGRMEVNVLGAMLLTRAAIEPMLEQGGGKVVTISSISAKVGGVPSRDPQTGEQRSGPTYSATKGALISFNRWVAVEYGPQGILANVICPGPVATPAIAGAEYDLSSYPIARLADPADVAAAVLFLASPMSNYVTGQTLNVDGGFRLD